MSLNVWSWRAPDAIHETRIVLMSRHTIQLGTRAVARWDVGIAREYAGRAPWQLRRECVTVAVRWRTVTRRRRFWDIERHIL
jgi:hypothetical protein